MPYSVENKPKVGDPVVFGRMRGEKTKGTIVKVNRTKAKIRQDESRGTMKAHQIGTTWTVSFNLIEPDTGRSTDDLGDVSDTLPLKTNPQPFTRAKSPLVGLKIVAVRKMTDKEMKAEYWDDNVIHGRPTVLELSDGTKLYPSRDDEGNGGGALFGVDPKGTSFRA